MNPWDQFTGANAGYVQELYERYQQDPGSVDAGTRDAFATWPPPPQMPQMAQMAQLPQMPQMAQMAQMERVARAPTDALGLAGASLAAFQLAESIRRFGHLAAHLDPLGFYRPVGDPSLSPQAHGIDPDAVHGEQR